MKKIKLIVATHKDYEFSKDKMYTPIHVGKAINNNDLGIQGDDTGDNISLKNQSFCELTALYWTWKNNFFQEVDYCGLVHYRRYFKGNNILLKGKYIASESELLNYLSDADILLPKQRNYYIETIKQHYKNAHNEKDLMETKQIIEELYPEYLVSFDEFMNQTKIYLFNMSIMKVEDFNNYCKWLFDILFTLEKRIDISDYDAYQKRVFGFLSERLFNVWVNHQNLKVKEISVSNIEGENLLAKGINMLRRKYKIGYTNT